MVLEILRSREDSPARESAPDALREEGEVARLAANRAGTTVRAIDAYPSYFTIDLQRNSAVSGVCVRSIGLLPGQGREQDGSMKLQLLYFDGCPNWHVADDRLQEAFEELGSRVEVERVLVSTQEEAQAWSFHGSPSVLVDGDGPFAEPDADVGLSCRLYRTPAGLAGAPTVVQLVEVLALSLIHISEPTRPY